MLGRMKARRDVIYFLIALAAILVAGDAIWWQTTQLAMEANPQWTVLNGGGPDTLRASIYRQAELNQQAAQEAGE